MSQRYAPLIEGLGSSGDPVEITPHNTNDLAEPVRALWIGTGGNVEVVGTRSTSAVVFKNVPSGTLLPVRARRVRAAGTDAQDIIGLI